LAARPRFSGDEAGNAIEGDTEDLVVKTGGRPFYADQGLELDGAGGVLDQAQAQTSV
jgi:hypothetical protein